MAVPTDRKYTSSHEWCKLDGDVAVVGVTQYAADQLSDITFVELPAVGSAVTAGEPFGEIESVKSAGDMYSPLSGEVLDANQAVADTPALINSDPFAAGWIFKIKPADPAQMDALLAPEAYDALVEES